MLFLTNNSSRDGEHYAEKLRAMGCDAGEEAIYTSGMATCQFLNRTMPGKKVYLLGNRYLKGEFRRHGVPLTVDNADVVVVGFDTTLDWAKLCRVCALVRSGIPYIATHPDYNCPTENGFVPDIGATIAYIKASTGRDPDVIIGKPHAEIVRGILERTGLTAGELAICGDRLYTDIATGVKAGILSVCVLTGEATPEEIAGSPVQPDLVFERLADLIPHIR